MTSLNTPGFPPAQSGRKPHRNRLTHLFGWLAFIALLTAGACNVIEQIPLPFLTPDSQPTPTLVPTTPTPKPIEVATSTPQPTVPDVLTLWLPPEFDPAGGSPAAAILDNRLLDFTAETGIEVEVRLKAASGPGSTLEALTAAASAAPQALPGVTALSRPDLENAAIKGLIYPLDGASTLIDDPDWYDYARQLAMVQGVTFGLPFAGDSLVVIYRPALVIEPPVTWEAILRLGQPVAFSAGSSQNMLTIALYRSHGGLIEDAQRRPSIDSGTLAEVLGLYSTAAQSAIFPTWLAEFETEQQAWQAFEDGRVNAVITWGSSYLKNRLPDAALTALPALGSEQVTLAGGWSWAVSDPLPERRLYSVHLAEWLSDPTFLAAWTEAAGALPTRPSSLTAWRDPGLRTILGQSALTAEARPSNDLLISLGPVLKEAVTQVIENAADPIAAAQKAAEQLTIP